MSSGYQEGLLKSLRRNLAVGAATVVVLVGGLFSWAATTELSGAAIAPGILIVEGNTKSIQHPTGGVISELLVREGQSVVAGEVLARLDATTTQADLAVITKGLNQLYARQARLEAERDNLATVSPPAELLARLTSIQVDSAMVSERRLFNSRRASQDGQKTRLREQVAQLQDKIDGHAAQQAAKDEEIALVEKELEAVRALYDRGLTPIDRVNNLARAGARLRGERGQLIAAIAETRGRISEIEVQGLQLDQSLRSEVATELRDLQSRQSELTEREVAARDRLKRIEIIAPIAGAIHQLAIHTIGGVVGPADVLLQIVPKGGELTVEARVTPQDVDQLTIGQSTTLRLSAFNRNNTPELTGMLTRVSADLVTDSKTGVSFYRAGIALPKSELSRVPGLELVPGMPVEAFILTGKRTVFSYLSKPISDHASRVFRED